MVVNPGHRFNMEVETEGPNLPNWSDLNPPFFRDLFRRSKVRSLPQEILLIEVACTFGRDLLPKFEISGLKDRRDRLTDKDMDFFSFFN